MNQKKLVIYTVITGEYDYLKDPEYISNNCDYICFTNNPSLRSNVWQIRLENNLGNLNATKWQRRHKVMTHEYLPEYEWSIYIDGNVRIIGDMIQYLKTESKGSPVLCLKHPYRNNAFEEAEECINLNKDLDVTIRAQMETYRKEGYMGENGLVASGILARKHMDPTVIHLMKIWWHEIETKSKRDQLSFNYACWKCNFQYDASELMCWKSPYWLNPGIHTNDIRTLEEELIDHIQLIALKEYQLQELNEKISVQEHELENVNTQLKELKSEMQKLNIQLMQEIQVSRNLTEELNNIKHKKIWKLLKLFYL